MIDDFQYEAGFPKRLHSRAGIASLLLGILCMVALFLSLTNRRGPTNSTTSAPAVSVATARLIGLACLACPVLGAALGIVGLRSKNRKRVTAGIGLCLNGLVILLLAAAVALFVAMG